MEGVTRERLLARQRRAAVVAARLNAAGTPAGTVALRCEQPHTGKRPVLAKLVATEQGILFSSRILWLPRSPDVRGSRNAPPYARRDR